MEEDDNELPIGKKIYVTLSMDVSGDRLRVDPTTNDIYLSKDADSVSLKVS
jgi:hypothetical protein